MAITLTIAGTTVFYATGSLDIIRRIDGRHTLSCRIFSHDGSYRPAVNAEVIVTEDGTRRFGGNIEDVEESTLGNEPIVNLEYAIFAVGFIALADRRYLSIDFPAQALKLSLETLVNAYLADYGVTYNAASSGPTLPALSYNTMTPAEILNDLCSIAGPLAGPPQAVVWEIDDNKVASTFGVLDSGHAAPFDVTTATAIIGEPRVRPTKTDYANYVIVLFGTGSKALVDTLGTGNGILTTFSLHYFIASHEGYVNVGGTVTDGVITGGVNETLGLSGSGATWIFDPGPRTVTRTSAPTGLILMPYTGNFPSVATATTGAAAADRVDRVYTQEAVFDYDTAVALATSLLQQTSATFKEVSYVIATSGCLPRQTQTITLAKHGISGAHLITEVRITDRVETQLWYEIKALSGTTTAPESWMDTYRLWSKGSAGSAGTVVVVSGSAAPQTYFLGGSAILYVQDPGPTWVAADAVRVTIDTAVRGSLTGTVRCRLRAASGNVTARLRNITDSSTAGTSGVVSSSSWTDADFAVTLTAGSKVYELQVLPSVANTDVAAVGYFE